METNSYPIQFVKKESSSGDFIKKAVLLLVFALILLILSSLKLPGSVFAIVALGCIFIFTAIIRNISCEYEYSVREDQFFVDVIYGVSKRKTAFSVDISHITEVFSTDSERFDEFYDAYCNILDFSSCETAEGRICFYCEEENLIFIIEPNQEIADALVEASKND